MRFEVYIIPYCLYRLQIVGVDMWLINKGVIYSIDFVMELHHPSQEQMPLHRLHHLMHCTASINLTPSLHQGSTVQGYVQSSSFKPDG